MTCWRNQQLWWLRRFCWRPLVVHPKTESLCVQKCSSGSLEASMEFQKMISMLLCWRSAERTHRYQRVKGPQPYRMVVRCCCSSNNYDVQCQNAGPFLFASVVPCTVRCAMCKVRSLCLSDSSLDFQMTVSIKMVSLECFCSCGFGWKWKSFQICLKTNIFLHVSFFRYITGLENSTTLPVCLNLASYQKGVKV